MIGFSCTNCGHTFSVQDDYSGTRIKCPKCDFVGLVIDDSGRIKITCQNCGNENNVPETLAGQEVKCPKCNTSVEVPPLKKELDENADDYPPEKIPEKSEQPETSEYKMIIIVAAIAAVIVTVLIIMAVVIANYK
jgi:DNA-directed RNA polymerase subunit RPC12/RpoP